MEVKFYKVCRACMANDSDTLNVSELKKLTDNIVEMFTFCTSIKVSKDDGLPSYVCLQCIQNINNCYSFINICKTTDTSLRFCLTRNKNLLVEPPQEIKQENEAIKQEMIFMPDDNLDDEDNIDNEEFPFNVEMKTSPVQLSNCDEEYCDSIAKVVPKVKTKIKLKLKSKDKSRHKKKSKPKLLLKQLAEKPLKKEYNCPVCQCVIVGKKELNIHLMEQHEEYRKYICAHCNKGFARSQYLKQHLIIHTNERPFACNLCPKTYKQSGQLLTHSRLHTKERPFSCDKCGMNFNMKCALVNHSKLHHGDEPNLCHLCGASFAQVGNLIVHMRAHTGEKPYACSMCPYRCSVQSGMRRHEKIHTNERAYVCKVCSKGFNNSSSLSRHTRIHTGELPYKCDYCSKAFIDNWKRKNHLFKVHNISLDMIPRMIPGRKRTYVKREMESSSTDNLEQMMNQS